MSPDDLECRVNRTCRGVAAFRAVELLHHPTPIVRDELSVQLAGPDRITIIKNIWQEAMQRSGCDPAAPHHLLFAARARILDDMIVEALQQLASEDSSTAVITCTSNAVDQGQQQLQQGRVCMQVVSVGCGVDTRPWRLAFPPGVAWFDVDQAPVINLKTKLLAEAGAEQQQQQQQQQQLKFPLMCSSYTALASDATSSSWLSDLAAAGFSRTLPTVWVLEGLLYYLTPAQGAQLYADIAAASRPGACVVLATHIPACNLEANKTCPASHSLAGLFKSWVGDLVGSHGQMLQHGATASSDDMEQAQQQQQQQQHGAAATGNSLQDPQQQQQQQQQQDSTAEVHDSRDMDGGGGGGSCSTAVGRWGCAEVSADLAVLLRERYNAEALYPYALEYSGGKPLPEIECVVTHRLDA